MTAPGHGGKRAGAGRKLVLSPAERLLVGAFCENGWRALAEDRSIDRYQRQAKIRQVRAAQSRADLVPMSKRKTRSARDTRDDIAGDIDDALNAQRLTTIPTAA